MRPSELFAGERNLEFAWLTASLAFVGLALYSLDAAAFALPVGTGRIVTQFALSTLAANIALRLLAPRASSQVFAIASFLTAIGLAMTIRLSPDSAQDQANWISAGVLAFAVMAWLGRRTDLLRRYTFTSGVAALVLLVFTGIFGETIYGARLWVTIAGQTIQTTELIKLFLVVFFAGYLADRGTILATPRVNFGGRTYSSLPYLVPLAVLLLMTIGALALLRDLGSIALIVLLAVAMLYVATGRFGYVAGGVGLLLATAALGYLAFDHAQVRIDTWLDPSGDPDDAGFQTLQSTYAIQAGGVTGEGLGLGQPDVIPAAVTDYVFSAIAEELGLAGAAGVVMLYLLLLYTGLRAAAEAPSNYARLLCAGISLLLAIQAAVIIAGNLRLIPTTGITLPFVSYGGSSLVVNFALLGLLAGISSTRQSATS